MVLIAFGEAEANHSLGYGGSSRQMPAGTASWGGDAALPSGRPGAHEAGEGPLEAGLLPLAAPRPRQESRCGAMCSTCERRPRLQLKSSCSHCRTLHVTFMQSQCY